MAYLSGIDLGTTFTAAAVWRTGAPSPEVVTLGSRSAAIPSIVAVRDDGTLVVGDAAATRAADAPDRVAREFKRRIGDPTPIFLGGSPWSPEALSAELLRAVLATVSQLEGGPPDRLVLTHPANWGAYKVDQLRQVVRLADVDVPVALLSEPEAAALHYAAVDRVPDGSVVAVYDLGGGTFDATILRVTGGTAEVLGAPEGIERLGGVDVDAAVFEFVRSHAAHLFEGLDPDDATSLAAVGQVREACQRAKEALSTDPDTTVVVALPTGVERVRITRAELEASVRPQLEQTVAAIQRALRAAGVASEQVDRVLLVGGSSRIPLIAQLLAGALGRPIAVDADPKQSIALGAARAAADDARFGVAPPAEPPAVAPEPPPVPVAAAMPAPAAPATKGPPTVLVGAAIAVVAVIVAAVVLLGGSGGGSGDGGADAATGGPSTTTAPTTGDPVIETIAGTGSPGFSEDGIAAGDSQLSAPSGVAIDADGRILVADAANNRIRAIDERGTITTIAGGSEPGLAGDGGPAVDALLAEPTAVLVDDEGQIFIADTDNHRIRMIDTGGTIRTVAGSGAGGGFNGDFGPATSALLASPRGIALGDDGTLFISDSGNNRIRAVAPDGTITTIAGSSANFSGDGGPATGAQFDFPRGLAIDADGRLLIADSGNNRIRAIDLETGTISTIAGTGEEGSEGDGGPATEAQLALPRGLAVDADGRILVADTDNNVVRAIDLGGTISTIAGTGIGGYDGDDGPATEARLGSPRGLVVTADGRIVVADTDNNCVRVIGVD